MLAALQPIPAAQTGTSSWQSSATSFSHGHDYDLTNSDGAYGHIFDDGFDDITGFNTVLDINYNFQHNGDEFVFHIAQNSSSQDLIGDPNNTGHIAADAFEQSSTYQIFGETHDANISTYFSASATAEGFGNFNEQGQDSKGQAGANGDNYFSSSSFEDEFHQYFVDFDGTNYTLNAYGSATAQSEIYQFAEHLAYGPTTVSTDPGYTYSSSSFTNSFSSSYENSSSISGAGGPFVWQNQHTELQTTGVQVDSTAETSTTISLITGYISSIYRTLTAPDDSTSTYTTSTTSNTTTTSSTDFTTYSFVTGSQTWMTPVIVDVPFLDQQNSYDYQTQYCPNDAEVLLTFKGSVTDLVEDYPYSFSDLYAPAVGDIVLQPVNDISVDVPDAVWQTAFTQPISDQLDLFNIYSESIDPANLPDSGFSPFSGTRLIVSDVSTSTDTTATDYLPPDFNFTGTINTTSRISKGATYTFYVNSILPMNTDSSTFAYQTTDISDYTYFNMVLTFDQVYGFRVDTVPLITHSIDEQTGFLEWIDDNNNTHTTIISRNILIAAGTIINYSAHDVIVNFDGQTATNDASGFAENGMTLEGGRTRSYRTGKASSYVDIRDSLFSARSPQYKRSDTGYQIAPYINKDDPVYAGVGAIYSMVYPNALYYVADIGENALIPYQFFYTGSSVSSFVIENGISFITFQNVSGESSYVATTTVVSVVFDTDGNSHTEVDFDTNQPETGYTISWDWLSSTADPYLNLSVTSGSFYETQTESWSTTSFINKLFPLGSQLQTAEGPVNFSLTTVRNPYTNIYQFGAYPDLETTGSIVGGQPRYDGEVSLFLQGVYGITNSDGVAFSGEYDDSQEIDFVTDDISVFAGLDVSFITPIPGTPLFTNPFATNKYPGVF